MPNFSKFLWGPHTRDGITAALLIGMLDQASKLWLYYAYDLAAKSPVKVLPVLDLVLTWNKGISYGLFQQDSAFGQWALFGVKVAATVFLWAWLSQATTRLTALSLGLIIGGALGNAVDRLAHGAVMDFVHLHTPAYGFNWYVFNLSDTAIVAGVALLLYEFWTGDRAAKAP
ncbi:MAG TPA: signal peptidase II [Pseudorhodoplanes sp.]|nr:signal peptidase II [Pseudorhodoplanes sp.]